MSQSPGFRLCPGWWGSRCPLLVVLGGSASSSQARPGAASHLAGHNNTTHPWAAAYTVHCRYLDIVYCLDNTISIISNMIAGLNTQRHTRPWALRENVQNLNYRYLDIYVASRYLYIYLQFTSSTYSSSWLVAATTFGKSVHSRSVDIYV